MCGSSSDPLPALKVEQIDLRLKAVLQSMQKQKTLERFRVLKELWVENPKVLDMR